MLFASPLLEMRIVYSQEPELTPFDLRWRMFGVYVRVHPFFWVLAAFLGWSFFEDYGLGYLLLWIGCVFVSILLHEFGHVVAGRFFGSDGHILLYWFGGLAVGSSDVRRRWQRVLVYLAGPLAQMILFVPALLIVLMPSLTVGWGLPLRLALAMLCLINGFWAVVNLLPIYPLDGGQVLREASEAVAPGRGGSFALGLSMVICAGMAVYLFLASQNRVPDVPYLRANMYNAILFASLAVSNFQAMQFESVRNSRDDRLPWER